MTNVSPPNRSGTQARIDHFRQDLSTAAPISDIARRHITTGEPVGLDADVYFQLRTKVADEFNVHPNAVVVVGSAKLGFSLKRKDGARYREMSPTADVDVAVVSDRLFDFYWDRVFAVVQDERHWAKRPGRRFVKDLFSGWVSPHLLPNLPRFAESRSWAEFFARLTRDRVCGYRTVSARLYRTWERLEAYQTIMVRACRRDLQGGL